MTESAKHSLQYFRCGKWGQVWGLWIWGRLLTAHYFCLSCSSCNRSYYWVGCYGSEFSNNSGLIPHSSLKFMCPCLRVAVLPRSDSSKLTLSAPFPLASALQITHCCKLTCVSFHLPITTIIKSMTPLKGRFRRQGQAISHRGASLPAETGTVTDVISSDPRSPSFLTHTQESIITSMAEGSGSFCRGAPRISLQVRSSEESVHSWTPHYLLHHSHPVSSGCLVKFPWFLVVLYTNLLIFKI